MNHQVVTLANAFPTLVPVHGVVATNQRGDNPIASFYMVLEISDKAQTALWVCIAAIGQSMNEYS